MGDRMLVLGLRCSVTNNGQSMHDHFRDLGAEAQGWNFYTFVRDFTYIMFYIVACMSQTVRSRSSWGSWFLESCKIKGVTVYHLCHKRFFTILQFLPMYTFIFSEFFFSQAFHQTTLIHCVVNTLTQEVRPTVTPELNMQTGQRIHPICMLIKVLKIIFEIWAKMSKS